MSVPCVCNRQTLCKLIMSVPCVLEQTNTMQTYYVCTLCAGYRQTLCKLIMSVPCVLDTDKHYANLLCLYLVYVIDKHYANLCLYLVYVIDKHYANFIMSVPCVCNRQTLCKLIMSVPLFVINNCNHQFQVLFFCQYS